MDPYLETVEEIDNFLRDFSDPYKEHEGAQCSPESHLCMPPTAAGESGQQGSSQSQGMLPWRPTGMTGGSCDVLGRPPSQNAATPPDEALDTILEELTEIFERKGQAMTQEQAQPTAGYQNTHVIGTPQISHTDCPKTHVAASEVTVSEQGSQMQDTRCDQTLNGIQVTASWPDPMNNLNGNQSLSGGQPTATLGQQIFYLGGMPNTVGDQSLYLKQVTDTWNGQRLNGDQVVTLSNGQTLRGGYQLVAVAQPGLVALPGGPPIQVQLPEHNGSFQTKSSPLPKNPQSSRPYVCPHQGCGKSYWRSSYLRVHQRTHSGQKPYACNVPGCKWRFNRSDELKRHMRRHTGERPYTCQICQKTFPRSDHVTQHQRVHTRPALRLAPSSPPGTVHRFHILPDPMLLPCNHHCTNTK